MQVCRPSGKDELAGHCACTLATFADLAARPQIFSRGSSSTSTRAVPNAQHVDVPSLCFVPWSLPPTRAAEAIPHTPAFVELYDQESHRLLLYFSWVNWKG